MISALALASCISGVVLDEGYKQHMYKDRTGWSIGNGYSLTHNPLALPKSQIARYKHSGISKAEARHLVDKMCHVTAENLSAKYTWFDTLPSKSQYVMLNMAYNLGIGGLSEFDKTLRYIKHNQVTMASKEMLASRWARQVKTRAVTLASVISS